MDVDELMSIADRFYCYKTASAAWKARCKYYRAIYDIAVDDQCDARDRAFYAEKRVAELEEALEWLDTAIMPDERKYDRNGWGRIHKQTLREFDRKVKAALNKPK